MKHLFLSGFLSLIIITGCSKDEENHSKNNNTLGYYKGMERPEYEYVTGQHIESGLFRHHWSGAEDMYNLRDKCYEENPPDTNYDKCAKSFYPTFIFNLYGEKLVSVDIEFRHEGTIRSNESRMLYPEEIEEIMKEIKQYFKELNISATFETVPYTDQGNSEEIESYEIIGSLNL